MPKTYPDLFFETVVTKSLIAFPFLLIVFYCYGVNHEHGDVNAGLMYPTAFLIHIALVCFVTYSIYFFVDKFTYRKRINPVKNFVHLILAASLLFTRENVILILVILTLPTLLVINLITWLITYPTGKN
ncbi:hypothetical protein [uncultured Mucilaginibacter sp.]|uniref:hypothetical protein n=1 Tax=uncultured Mucilaginibacter sp. TaxID=797541 RepID=UPI0025EE829E|nr:hypothetical protein [uncultured Mucilaginibacter sp.]